jgi:hypothetical protein
MEHVKKLQKYGLMGIPIREITAALAGLSRH